MRGVPVTSTRSGVPVAGLSHRSPWLDTPQRGIGVKSASYEVVMVYHIYRLVKMVTKNILT